MIDTSTTTLSSFARFAGGTLPAPGIYPDFSREDYDLVPAVNQSLIKRVLRSPAHGLAMLEGLDEQTDPQKFGADYHVYLLEPARFARTYAVMNVPRDAKTDWGAEYFAAFENADDPKAIKTEKARCAALWAEAEKRVGRDNVLPIGRVEMFAKMRERLRRVAKANKLLCTPGLVEVSVFWIDATTGLYCKTRIDKAVPGTIALDVKKTRDACARKFHIQIAEYGYDVQGAFIVDGLAAVGKPGTEYVLIAQEDYGSYEPSLHELGRDEVAVGRGLARMGLQAIRRCLDTGEWPGYGEDIYPVQLPKWRYQQSAFVGEADASQADAQTPWQFVS